MERAPNDDGMYVSHWNGAGSWSPVQPLSGNSSAGPSLAVFDGVVYAAWKGEWSDPRLFAAKLIGANLASLPQIPNAYSNNGPALCEFNDSQLFAAWANFDQGLFYSVYGGTEWSEPSPIPGTASSVGPSLALFNGELYAAWKGEGADQRLWYSYYNGSSWSAQATIPGTGSSVGPSPRRSMGSCTRYGRAKAATSGCGSHTSMERIGPARARSLVSEAASARRLLNMPTRSMRCGLAKAATQASTLHPSAVRRGRVNRRSFREIPALTRTGACCQVHRVAIQITFLQIAVAPTCQAPRSRSRLPKTSCRTQLTTTRSRLTVTALPNHQELHHLCGNSLGSVLPQARFSPG